MKGYEDIFEAAESVVWDKAVVGVPGVVQESFTAGIAAVVAAAKADALEEFAGRLMNREAH